jgi:hypothetical protein
LRYRLETSPGGDDERVTRMIALSARMVADATFARQLRRKFVHFERGQMLQKSEAE